MNIFNAQQSGKGSALSPVEIAKYEDYADIARLDLDAYGAETITYDGLMEWRERYHDGAFVLKAGSRICGALGLWPVTQAAFEKITRGELEDPDILPEHIFNASNTNRCHHWYLSDLIITEDLRKRKDCACTTLIVQSLNEWRKNIHYKYPVSICAILLDRIAINSLKDLNFDFVGNRCFVKQINSEKELNELHENKSDQLSRVKAKVARINTRTREW